MISHVINSIDKATGGPARSVSHLLNHLAQLSTDYIMTLETGLSENPITLDFGDTHFKIKFYEQDFLGRFINFNSNSDDQKIMIFHGHGIWQLPIHQMAKKAQLKSIPYVISPRGMLDVWSLQNKSGKKKMALFLYQKKDLMNASCLHATSETEAENIKKLGFNNPIAVIPNGIKIPSFESSSFRKSKKQLLFLSRLVKNKGIEELLNVWKLIDDELIDKWELIIVGGGEKAYENRLKNICKKLELKNIVFTGAIYGEAKYQYLKNSDVFVLPSYSENFGIAIAEALACGKPVITTKGTPWEELNMINAGWWIDFGTDSLKNALQNALSLTDEERTSMGLSGRKLVEEKYSIQVVARHMLELYDWILGKREKPEFVR